MVNSCRDWRQRDGAPFPPSNGSIFQAEVLGGFVVAGWAGSIGEREVGYEGGEMVERGNTVVRGEAIS